ncbi:hypothetical protein ACFSSF_18735 [Dietzia aerolata]|uniref:hypothetical protein n=1 Tax=Dietzia aerolata TaxID=595984 RepID=UPI00364573E0
MSGGLHGERDHPIAAAHRERVHGAPVDAVGDNPRANSSDSCALPPVNRVTATPWDRSRTSARSTICPTLPPPAAGLMSRATVRISRSFSVELMG